MTTDLSSISAAALRRAADIKETIETLGRELASLVGGSTPAAAKPVKRHTMSAAGRAKIAAAQRARWAKTKKPTLSAKAIPVKKRRPMSPAVKAKLSALAKARWSKIKAGGKKSV
jgi:hypothetical protein